MLKILKKYLSNAAFNIMFVVFAATFVFASLYTPASQLDELAFTIEIVTLVCCGCLLLVRLEGESGRIVNAGFAVACSTFIVPMAMIVICPEMFS